MVVLAKTPVNLILRCCYGHSGGREIGRGSRRCFGVRRPVRAPEDYITSIIALCKPRNLYLVDIHLLPSLLVSSLPLAEL